MNKLKVAVDGLQTGHIKGMTKCMPPHPAIEVVAVAERDPDSCQNVMEISGLAITHASLDALIDEVDFDVLFLNTHYALRGEHAIRALEANKHVFSDKPLCLNLSELDRIEFLSRERNLSVFNYLTLRYNPYFVEARRRLENGDLGDIATIYVNGRHPLKYGRREPWFFEPGAQGGTINDILIHGIDAVEGIAGLRIQQMVAGRQWNQRFESAPHFPNCAQVMFMMENGAGVLMDGSFTVPDGHRAPWELCFCGAKGDLFLTTGSLLVRIENRPEESVEIDDSAPGRHIIQDLVDEIIGNSTSSLIMDTARSLRASRIALSAQQIVERGGAFADL